MKNIPAAEKENRNKGSNKKRSRERKILWFNPPFILDVKTNVGKDFLKIIDEVQDLRHHSRLFRYLIFVIKEEQPLLHY